jgi:hypothetical protein
MPGLVPGICFLNATSLLDGPKDLTRNLKIIRCAKAHQSSMLRIAPE